MNTGRTPRTGGLSAGMAKSRAHFSSNEMAVVLSHFDIGIIRQLKSLSAGNPQTPKTVVVSDKGLYILKRRPHGKDDPIRVSLAHAIRAFLVTRGYPVAAAMHPRDNSRSFLHINDHIYELFEYIRGTRYDGSIAQTRDAGRRLGQFHAGLAEFVSEYRPVFRSFHDSRLVRQNLSAIEKCNGNSDPALRELGINLLRIYDTAAIRVNDMGLSEWPEMFTHGDWHPGNIMFEGPQVKVVLDLDSIKLAPAPTDLANGLLQFSIIGGATDPASWPDELDINRLSAFITSYREVFSPGNCAAMLPDLMIETMIAEAVMPVAATGSFGNMQGLDFLRMIYRKCVWIDTNRQLINVSLAV